MDSDSDNDYPSDSDDSSMDTAAVEEQQRWINALQKIKGNDRQQNRLFLIGYEKHLQYMSDEDWEELGHDISNNTHLTTVRLQEGALDDHEMSFLFRGLTRSSSIKDMLLHDNELSIAGIQSMVPFLQNASNLRELNLSGNSLRSEGFNLLLRELRNSPIEELCCSECAIESIAIDTEHTPRHLKDLVLHANSINADGCRELAKLLQGGITTLESLHLQSNKIDDDAVEILTNALRSNACLKTLHLSKNEGISDRGKMKLLRLVNDISSIEATLESNHTLNIIFFDWSDTDAQIRRLLVKAIVINRLPEQAAWKKMIETQLHSATRAEWAELQGVRHSVYSEINPLHLPEILALVGRHHGQGELFIALKASIAGVISTVDRKECIRQQIAYHQEKLKELSTELAAIEAAEGAQGDGGRNKRRRAC